MSIQGVSKFGVQIVVRYMISGSFFLRDRHSDFMAIILHQIKHIFSVSVNSRSTKSMTGILW